MLAALNAYVGDLALTNGNQPFLAFARGDSAYTDGR